MPEEPPALNKAEQYEYERFANEFTKESDRAAVILGAAKLDLMLGQILERVLLPCASGRDELLEGDSPLSTFSARINICFRLGIIASDLSRALHLVRRIRNSFAHEVSGVTLESGAHRDRITELVMPLRAIRGFDFFLSHYFAGKTGPSIEFRAAVALLTFRLEGAFRRASLVAPETPTTFIPPLWKKPPKPKKAKKTPNAPKVA